MAAEAMKVGSRLGPYELLSPIGAGGMGEVWKARDTRLDRVVAIKFSQAQFSERFEREARAIAALNHPNIAQIYDVGENCIVMEFVDGEPVRPPDNVRKLLDVAVQIADGLAAAHAAGFVHRDLKPDNILITKSGRVKILDFGLAKHAIQAAAGDATRTISVTDPGTILGSVAYMSPEQARGQELDARSDQFSFGLILYELATGKRAFQRASAAETMAAILRDDPEPLPASVPMPLHWIIERCLAKDPEQRYDTTRGLYLDLRAAIDRVSFSHPAAATVAPRPRRARWSLITAAVSLTLAAGVTIGWLRQPWRPDVSQYRFVPFAAEDGAETFPVWSPDGRSIAYTVGAERAGPGNTQLMVKGVDSDSPVRLAQGPGIISPAWSGDGSRIYYLARQAVSSPFEVTSVARAGGEPAPLFGPGAIGARNPIAIAVTRDGSTLAIIGSERSNNRGIRRIWLSSPPGAPLQVIPNFEGACCSVPSWISRSPDGSQLLAAIPGSGNFEVWAISRSGANHKVFSETDLGTVAHTVSWMSGGRYAVIAGTRTRDVKLADVAAGTATTVLPSLDIIEAAVSPDGKRIAFTAREPNQYLLELPLDGSPPRPWLSSRIEQHSPSWSPVRDELAYVRESEIRVRARDGSSDRIAVSRRDFPEFTGPLQFLAPAISPDGSRVAYMVKGLSREAIYISPVTGGPPARLGGDPSERAHWPSWSPDGAWIAYASYGRVPAVLRKLRVGSNDPVDIAPRACAPDWSPDGRWILCPAARLQMISPDGKETRDLGEHLRAATWSRDSKTVYAIRSAARRELVAIAPDNGTLRVISSLREGIWLFSGQSTVWRPSLSRDGKTLLITANRAESDIWILDGFEPPPGLVGEPMAAPALKSGTRVGPYELLAPIGAGGMGEVWKARDTRLDQVVAVRFSQVTDRF